MNVKADCPAKIRAVGITKTLRIMRLTAIFLLVFSLTVSARGRAQDRVTLHLKGASLETVLNQIQAQTGYTYVYSALDVPVTKKFDINVTGATVEDVLDMCFKNLPMRYEISNRLIKIVRRTDMGGDQSGLIKQGQGHGHGDLIIYVRSEDGFNLPGATIHIVGLNVTTTSDASGELERKNVPNGQYQAEITYVGYETVRGNIEVNDQPVMLTFFLKHTQNNLDQVQIIAYGHTTQRLGTGDVTTVNSQQMRDEPVSNPLMALEGMVPGLFVTQSTGMAGGAFQVQVRGQNSLQNGNDPFYVIDGVPYTSQLLPNENPALSGNPLNFINPSDIESISVLKDADATAIYGSRAANGAILITTKKGKAGRTRVDLDAYTGVGRVPLKTDWLNTPQYLEMREEAFKNDGETPDQFSAPDLTVWDTTRYTDWQKALIGGAAKYNDVQASISGGSDYTQFLFRTGYNGESTVFPDAGLDGKVSAHMNITTSSTDRRFKASITANYLYDRSDLPGFDLTSFVGATSPDAPMPFNSDGSLNWANNSWILGAGNPYAYTKKKYEAHTNNLVSNAVVSYSLIKGLEIRSNFGFTNMQTGEVATNPVSSQNPAFYPVASANFTTNSIQSWIIEPQADYLLYLGRNKFEALAGSTFDQSTSNGQILYATGFSSDVLVEDLQAATSLRALSLTNDVYKYNALFGRLSYNYDDKYLANLNVRRDGSSRFGPNRQFHNFGSGGVGWVFSKEDFMSGARRVLSFGKLSASYGTTGNDQIGNYTFYDLYNSVTYPYQNVVGINPTRLYNPNLAWEETRKLEGSIDLGFLKDKLLAKFAYYRNRSSDQLVQYPLSTVTGFSSISLNLPAVVQNEGYEVTVQANSVKIGKFSWTSALNVSVPRNKLVAFPNLAASSYKYLYIVGQPVSIVQAYHLTGVDSATGVYTFASKSDPFNPSFITDRTALINLTPKFYGGFRNTFRYGGFELDILFQFIKQMGQSMFFQSGNPPGSAGNNQPVEVLKRWQKAGDKGPYEEFTQDFGSNASNEFSYAQTSDRNYTDASYIRLKTAGLSFDVPRNWKAMVHMQTLRIYVRAENLLTITKYKELDPENQSIGALPPLRVFTTGVQIGL